MVSKLDCCSNFGNVPLRSRWLVPDTLGAMMWNAFMALRLHLFHAIVEEEIYKNGIKMRLRVLTLDFLLQQLDAPNAAPAQLNLPRVTAFDKSFLPDVRV